MLPMAEELTFDAACSTLEDALRGETRREILKDVISRAKNLDEALIRLRGYIRAHQFKAGNLQLNLAKLASQFDERTQKDGFHVLRDWDGKADRLLDETIPIDVLDYLGRSLPTKLLLSSVGGSAITILAILLDYYFLYLIALLCLRAWDEGDPNDNLDRLTAIVRDLQGPGGSGQKFVDNAETVILMATSHFEPDDKAYLRLLDKQRSLDLTHQVNIGLVHAAILASHLRHGFQDLYKRDLVLMREDNVPDYPCLCFAVTVLMRGYARKHEAGVHDLEREKIVEGIINGLTPDARAFLGKPPASLMPSKTELEEFVLLFHRHKEDLFKEFELHRPTDKTYTPIGFTFNFPHNLLKGIVVDALFKATPSILTLNQLLSGLPRDEELTELRVGFARTLMAYARSSPDTIRGKVTPTINYDPFLGLRNYNKTIGIIREYASAGK